MATNNQATGIICIRSAARPECHAPSGYDVKAYSGKPAANGIAPRDRQRNMILGFWQSLDWARQDNGAWFARDLLNGAVWLPLASNGDAGRGDRAELSHIISAANGGAWCACNLIPENGAANAARGDRDISSLPGDVRHAIAEWPFYWRQHHARPASIARLQRAGLAY